MHLVLAYDVVQDNRRQRLYTKLQGFLQPVQKSVFEGHLPARRLPALIDLVEATVDLATDSVRIYHLCKGCRGLTEHIGTARRVAQAPEDIII